jgi:photosystem II stability/assembly factor-like uncharacterized protein
VLPAAIVGLAVSADDPKRILATGPGIYLSVDGGRSWKRVREAEAGIGPVAWAPSAAQTAYAVGFDRVLLETTDGGATWNAVR